MLAADAVFSRERLSLDIGEGLGQWEEKVWPDLFIAQSGVYWSPSDLNLLVKSRELSPILGDGLMDQAAAISD
jgi:hypothetical protein